MKKILVIKTHAIGDVLMATPALRALRTYYPHAEISVLIGKWSAPILKNNPYITRCIEFDEAIFFKKKIINIVQLLIKLRSLKFDMAFILHGSLVIHFFLAIAGIKERFGLSRKGKNFLLTASIEENGSYDYYYPMNFIRLACLMKSSNSECFQDKDVRLDVFSTDLEMSSARNFLVNKGVKDFTKIISIAPGGSVNPKEKIYARIWPYEYFIQVIRKINQEFPEFAILLTGANSDKFITEKIHKELPQTIDLSGETNLQELTCIIGMSRLIICNDSSALHISIAKNQPTIGIFGPTSMKSRVPPQQIINCIQSAESCSPCYYFGKFIGCNKNGVCMKSILPDLVFKKVKRIILT